MAAGSTVTSDGGYDVMVYSCCINADRGIYYYKTYINNQITAIQMTEQEKSKKGLSVYSLAEEQQIKYENR